MLALRAALSDDGGWQLAAIQEAINRDEIDEDDDDDDDDDAEVAECAALVGVACVALERRAFGTSLAQDLAFLRRDDEERALPPAERLLIELRLSRKLLLRNLRQEMEALARQPDGGACQAMRELQEAPHPSSHSSKPAPKDPRQREIRNGFSQAANVL